MNLCRSHACECLQKYLRFININLTLLLLIIYSFPEYQKPQNAQNYNLKKKSHKNPKVERCRLLPLHQCYSIHLKKETNPFGYLKRSVLK